jgi:hypothetical protein
MRAKFKFGVEHADRRDERALFADAIGELIYKN